MPARRVNARIDRLAKRKQLGLKYGSVLPLGKLWHNRQITGGLLPSEIRESRNLSPGSKVMFSALAEWEATQASVYPSVKRLGLDTGFSEKQARRYVQELEEAGLIRVERNKDAARPGLNLPNRYVFLAHPIYDNPPAFMTDSSGAESDNLLPNASATYSQIGVKNTPNNGSQVTPASNIKERQEEEKREEKRLRFQQLFNEFKPVVQPLLCSNCSDNGRVGDRICAMCEKGRNLKRQADELEIGHQKYVEEWKAEQAAEARKNQPFRRPTFEEIMAAD